MTAFEASLKTMPTYSAEEQIAEEIQGCLDLVKLVFITPQA